MEKDDILGIVAIVGEEGTGKTSMALSFPRKIVHFDIDVGGFRRAAWRLPDAIKVKLLRADEKLTDIDSSQYDIASKPYPKPLQLEKLLGQQVEKVSSRMLVKFPKKVEGMKELWQTIVIDFVAACQMPEVCTIVFDSATLLWNITHNSVLQEAQERQLYRYQLDHKGQPFDENDFRERLQAIEYGPANEKITQLFHTARSFQKNLILTHYPTDVYGPVPDGKGGFAEGKTGERTLDGYKSTGKLVDIVVWTAVKEQTEQEGKKIKTLIAKFTKCGVEGMGLGAVGMEIPATFEGIVNLRRLLRGVKSSA